MNTQYSSLSSTLVILTTRMKLVERYQLHSFPEDNWSCIASSPNIDNIISSYGLLYSWTKENFHLQIQQLNIINTAEALFY